MNIQLLILFSVSFFILFNHKNPLLAQVNNSLENNQSINQEDNIRLENEQEIIYKIVPTIVEDEKVPIIFTNLPLNGLFLHHKIKFDLNGFYQTGENSSSNFFLNTIYKIDGKTVQSLSQDNIFISDYRANYVGIKTLNESTTTTVTITEPQTMQGFSLQQTFIGSCNVVGVIPNNPDSKCSFLPALVTDRNSVEPRFFLPTRIEQKGNIGQEITPENMAILQQPGFQNTGANGESFGLDLFFPNVGRLPGNSQGNQTDIQRRENIDNTNAVGVYRTRQIVKTNAEKAVLGRTIYGTNLIINDDNFLLNTVIGAIAQFLPEIDPVLEGKTEEANTKIEQNLFISANNTRIPDSSLVIYQQGLGEIYHNISSEKKDYNPTGKFNSIWLGLSPVRKRTLNTESLIIPINNQSRGIVAGGEGGINDNISFSVSTNEQNINSYNLNDFYIQAYLSFFERDVNLITRQVLFEETEYFPHLSFTGNITNNDQVIRYYTGVIASENPKFYLGGDYTKVINGWRFDFSSIYYVNPDQDYFSKVESNLSKKFRLSPNFQVSFSTGFRYALNRDVESILEDPTDNFFGIGTSINLYNISLNITQLFDVLPDSIGNKLQASIAFPIFNNVIFSAFLTPQRDIENYGLSLSYTNNGNRFGFLWNHKVYDYGQDIFGQDLETKDNIYQVFFKTTF